jgi:hypothetical protein
MNELFSNRYRFKKLAIAILLMMGLCAHTHIVGNRYAYQQEIILEKCLRNPTSCLNNLLVMRARIKHSPEDPFIAYPRIGGVYRLEYPVPLTGDLAGIQHGYVIDILGAYSSDTTFSVTKFQRDDWIRPVKYAVSLLGLLLTVVLLSRRFRFSSSRLFQLIDR